MPNALTIWAIRARHLLSHVLNTGSGGIDIFEVKLTFEMITVRGQQHSFSTHERKFLWKCQSFWDKKCLDLGATRTPNLRIHAECSNYLSYQGQTLAVPCFEHWLWLYRYFWSKANSWNVNCARATAFIFDTRTEVLVKVSKFLRQKMHGFRLRDSCATVTSEDTLDTICLLKAIWFSLQYRPPTAHPFQTKSDCKNILNVYSYLGSTLLNLDWYLVFGRSRLPSSEDRGWINGFLTYIDEQFTNL